MKINLLMWLVYHKKIMTSDNIRKRGVLGPSRCHLCEVQEETMEHLLKRCIFTSWLWDIFATTFQQSDRDNRSIINTLKKRCDPTRCQGIKKICEPMTPREKPHSLTQKILNSRKVNQNTTLPPKNP